MREGGGGECDQRALLSWPVHGRYASVERALHGAVQWPIPQAAVRLHSCSTVPQLRQPRAPVRPVHAAITAMSAPASSPSDSAALFSCAIIITAAVVAESQSASTGCWLSASAAAQRTASPKACTKGACCPSPWPKMSLSTPCLKMQAKLSASPRVTCSSDGGLVAARGGGGGSEAFSPPCAACYAKFQSRGGWWYNASSHMPPSCKGAPAALLSCMHASSAPPPSPSPPGLAPGSPLFTPSPMLASLSALLNVLACIYVGKAPMVRLQHCSSPLKQRAQPGDDAKGLHDERRKSGANHDLLLNGSQLPAALCSSLLQCCVIYIDERNQPWIIWQPTQKGRGDRFLTCPA